MQNKEFNVIDKSQVFNIEDLNGILKNIAEDKPIFKEKEMWKIKREEDFNKPLSKEFKIH